MSHITTTIVSKIEFVAGEVNFTPTYKIEESTSGLVDEINNIYNTGLGQYVLDNIDDLQSTSGSIEDWFVSNGTSWIGKTETNYHVDYLPTIENITEL